MARRLTIATVHFQAKVSEAQHFGLMQGAQAAGVAWGDAVEIIKRHLHVTGRTFAQVQLEEMLEWSAEDWQRAGEGFV